MKVLSIDSPQRLKDRTVKASIIVGENDFVPLIMLADRAYKGDAIEIGDALSEKEDTPAYEILTKIQRMLVDITAEIAKIANLEGVLNTTETKTKEDV